MSRFLNPVAIGGGQIGPSDIVATPTIAGALVGATVGQPYDVQLTVTPAGSPVTLGSGFAAALAEHALVHDGFGRFTSASVTTAGIVTGSASVVGGNTLSLSITVAAGAAVVPGLTPPTFAIPPSVAYHPHSQAGSVTKSGNRVTACPDLMGLAALAGGPTTGPIEMTDALGRKFWRFEDTTFATIANTLNAYSARGYTVQLVVRHHRALATTFFSPRYSAYTDDGTNTAYAGGGIRAVTAGNAAPRLYNAGVDTSTDATNGAYMVTGAQLQVITLASRPTAGGGTRAIINSRAVSVAQSGVVSTSLTGGVICGIPGSGNAVTAAAGVDVYFFAVWKGAQTDADTDSQAAASTSHYAIAAIDTALALEGDSITQGTGLVTSGLNLAMLLTQPGTPLIPGNIRVTNIGASGNTTEDLIARRNATGSLASKPLPGGPAKNLVAVQIGRNNWGSLGQTGAQSYDRLKVVLGDATSGSEGWLVRGWSAVAVVNIASSLAACYDQRALMLSSLVTDLQAAPGQTYAGRVTLLRADLIAIGGQTIFEDSADATNTAYYAGDSTHPNITGAELLASGGDTPANGMGAIA